MADTHKVPPDVTASGDRVRQRNYGTDFARLPRSEVHERTGHGGGPEGPLGAGRPNIPMLVMAVGAVLTFAVFVVNSAVVLVLGLLLMLIGALMSIVIHHRPGRR